MYGFSLASTLKEVVSIIITTMNQHHHVSSRLRHLWICVVVCVLSITTQALAEPLNGVWQALESGLYFGEFPAPIPHCNGDAFVRVLRIDPQHFELRLLTASASGCDCLLTAKEWCQQHNLVAAINAAMYQTDYRTSVSLMRTRDHVNNPRLSKDNTVLAFDPLSPDVPVVKIIDRQCEDFERWRSRYGTLVQSIRMISCTGRNVWRQQPQTWSTAAIAVDQDGWVLFIHVRAPYSTHDVIDMLLDLPLRISRAMYAEGGHEAQLYIRSGTIEYEFIGKTESALSGNHENGYAWPIPNVIGVMRRSTP